MKSGRQQQVVVIGAGIGGLATALLLAHRGLGVTVLERHPAPGGKIRQQVARGLALDAGPTVFTMRWVFDELLERVGHSLDAQLALAPLSVLARHAWADGSRLDLFADPGRSADAIGQLAGAREARGFLGMLAEARATYRTLERPYLGAAQGGPLALAARVGWRGLPALARIGAFRTLWPALGRHLHDARLHQLFGRYATYCGASPFAAPATLMLIAHVEQDGVWSVAGGMHALARMLAGLAGGFGARMRYGEAAAEVQVAAGRAGGVRLATGEVLAADAVVFNGDVQALASGALGADACGAVGAVPPAARSLSAITWALAARAGGDFEPVRHNVFFSADYPAEFGALFGAQALPAAPTVYVCAQDRGDPADAQGLPSAGPERLLCLVNAPPVGDRGLPEPSALARCEAAAFARLRQGGLVLEPDAATVRTTPADFDQAFPGSGGALYGRATHGWRSSFQRPGARSRLPGLYLCGGGVHPGPGVPMAALSGVQAARAVLADLGLSAP